MAKAHGKIGHFPMVMDISYSTVKKTAYMGRRKCVFLYPPLNFSLWSRKVAEKIKVGNHAWKSATEICDENELGIT